MDDNLGVFIPLNGRVMVEIDIEPQQTKGGLWLPESSLKKSEYGWVRAVASDINIVKNGDKILFDKYAGTVIKIDGKECIVIPEDSILGIMKEPVSVDPVDGGTGQAPNQAPVSTDPVPNQAPVNTDPVQTQPVASSPTVDGNPVSEPSTSTAPASTDTAQNQVVPSEPSTSTAPASTDTAQNQVVPSQVPLKPAPTPEELAAQNQHR
jgi:chaperonin GroES